nr:hypothetical protein HK105_007690 [Polyrhizophydium stewartii]
MADAADEDERRESGRNYSWEEDYKRSWDMLLEDDQGSLQGIVANLQQQQLLLKRRRLNKDTDAVAQRGIIRQLFVVVDQSSAMAELDLRPNRLDCTLNLLEAFVTEFFDQNPLSHVGVTATRDGGAEKWAELSGNPADLVRVFAKRESRQTSGEPSLQNALELARRSLAHVPQHVSREILVVFGSLTSCDPGNLGETIESLASDHIRVSVVGTYGVVMNDAHYKELLFDHIPPPALAVAQQSQSNIIQMGFPIVRTFDLPVLCICHQRPIRRGHICPRCAATICEIPTDCCICSLTLVSSPSLARSYHHLFPVPAFVEVPAAAAASAHPPAPAECFCCLAPFAKQRGPDDAYSLDANGTANGHGAAGSATSATAPHRPGPSAAAGAGSLAAATGAAALAPPSRFACPLCKTQVCLECDVYIHDVLHNCPGCLSGGHPAGR